MCLIVVVYANKESNSTLRYIKAVGTDILRLLCNNLDMILESLGESNDEGGEKRGVWWFLELAFGIPASLLGDKKN